MFMSLYQSADELKIKLDSLANQISNAKLELELLGPFLGAGHARIELIQAEQGLRSAKNRLNYVDRGPQ